MLTSSKLDRIHLTLLLKNHNLDVCTWKTKI